ncbi:MAG: aldolase/citrate lyase family protein [Bryobacterales bacterium]|nr:aldolase/citrate lyase family protein [Bryobacterales bacterium]
MRINYVKKALKEGRPQYGCGFSQFRCPDVARVLAAAGFNWTFLDSEHGPFNHETIQDICRASVLAGLCPVVRVADMQYDLVARALDCGGQGVVFPRVESPEVLEKAVAWCRFPPVGIRGFGLIPMQVDFEAATIPQIAEHMNEHTLVVLQIETQKAVDARDELLSVPGVDAVMVGPVDLSISLGVPGDFMHPKMVDAMDKIREACVRHGVAPGTQTRNPQLARFWKERGMLFLGCNNEVGMMFERAKALVAELSA